MLRKYHRFPETLPIITIKSKIKSTASSSCLLLCLEMRENKKEVDNLCKGTCKLGTDISIRFPCPDCLQPFHQHTSLLFPPSSSSVLGTQTSSFCHGQKPQRCSGVHKQLFGVCSKANLCMQSQTHVWAEHRQLCFLNSQSFNQTKQIQLYLKKNISNAHTQSVIQP